MILNEGQNQLNVQMVPVAAALPFVFSNVSLRQVPYYDAMAFNTLLFNCTITNPTSIAATRRIHLKWKYKSFNDIEYPWGSVITLKSFNLALAPGESYDFEWDGNYNNSGPLVSRRTWHAMWMEDEDGNKSEEKWQLRY